MRKKSKNIFWPSSPISPKDNSKKPNKKKPNKRKPKNLDPKKNIKPTTRPTTLPILSKTDLFPKDQSPILMTGHCLHLKEVSQGIVLPQLPTKDSPISRELSWILMKSISLLPRIKFWGLVEPREATQEMLPTPMTDSFLFHPKKTKKMPEFHPQVLAPVPPPAESQPQPQPEQPNLPKNPKLPNWKTKSYTSDTLPEIKSIMLVRKLSNLEGKLKGKLKVQLTRLFMIGMDGSILELLPGLFFWPLRSSEIERSHELISIYV